MAARKLKFKPKPLVGGAIRRPREKEDVPELTTQGLSIKQEPSNNVTLSNIQKDQNSVGNVGNISEASLKRISIEVGQKPTLGPSTDTDVENSDLQSCPASAIVEGPTEQTENITNNEISDQNLARNISKVQNINYILNKENDNSMTPTSQELTCERSNDECISSLHTNNSLSPNTSQESDVTSTDKTVNLTAKEPTRFGRSKFKPVLNRSIPRKKGGVDFNLNDNHVKSDTHPIAIIRAGSVIKNTELETEKSIAISEITESFSALESDECELSRQIQKEENNFSKNTSAIDSSIVQTNCNLTNSNKVYLVNTINVIKSSVNESDSSNVTLNKNIDQTDTIQSLQQSVDSSPNSNVPNNNFVTSSTTKVPISPLKFTSKVLVPKPCPNLLDPTVRRIIFHGSDSEEESKSKIKVLNNDKRGKQIKKEQDSKNKKRKLSQGSTYSKLGQEALEKFNQKFGKVKKLEPSDKTKLTMLDLIFYNPKSNPMTTKTEPAVKKSTNGLKCEISGIVKETLEEQSVDDVEEVAPPAPAVPVPQLKVGPDGQVMLDPNSLVIETTEVKEKRAVMENSEVIRDTGITRYNTYSKKKHSRKEWTAQETLQFYKALNTIGTDFTLMTKLFPKRSRHELKLKFKKEEKTNLKLVDKAMTAPADFDFKSLEEEMRRENEEIARLEDEKKMAAEEARKARALKKEDKAKNKGKRVGNNKNMRIKDAAFKHFDEAEVEKIKEHMTSKKVKSKKRRVKKKQIPMLIASSSDEEDIPITIDLDSDEADLEESELKILKMLREQNRSGSRRSPRKKATKKLEEYEEINQTLKRKLEEIDSDISDGYTPNGLGADMLFGSPARDPFPEESQESHWSMEITDEPAGADTGLDGVVQLVASGEEAVAASQRSTLDTQLICESIEIIRVNENGESIMPDQQSVDENLSKGSDEQESRHNIDPLPSFESVGPSHPPDVYSIQEPYSGTDSKVNEESVSEESTQVQQSVVIYYRKNSEESILGE